ncbi:MAG: universal stress protein [Rhodospirillaceae bacterium]|nr:MAG: universal stress protein [Rhodospirillaceae bacterium]
MTIKHILVPLTGAGHENHVPLCALRVAQRLNAHVMAMDTVGDPEVYIDPAGVGMSPAYYGEIQEALDKAQAQKRARARKAFDEAVAITKVPIVDKPTCGGPSTYWITGSKNENATVAAMGRLTDLVVVNRPGANDGFAERESLEDAVFAAHRPALVVPHGITEISKDAAIAWNGSPEAANAVERALELLEPGSKITIIQVGEIQSGGTPVSELVDYLGWHCFQSEVCQIADQPKATARLILHAAKKAGVGLLIMGAYTHSRLREMILGGVTDQMLKTTDIPVLMVH